MDNRENAVFPLIKIKKIIKVTTSPFKRNKGQSNEKNHFGEKRFVKI